MLSSAHAVAALMLVLPVRIWASIVRRMLPFSTLTQFFAVGTNQLRLAARSLTLVPSRLVAFGMFPFAWRPFSPAVLGEDPDPVVRERLVVRADRHGEVGAAEEAGHARPLVWLGITNCFVAFVYFLPTQQLNHAGPTIEAAWPWP